MDTKVSALETKAINTGNSLSFACQVLDSATQYCCVNADTNKLFCTDDLTKATEANITKISEAGVCGTSNVKC